MIRQSTPIDSRIFGDGHVASYKFFWVLGKSKNPMFPIPKTLFCPPSRIPCSTKMIPHPHGLCPCSYHHTYTIPFSNPYTDAIGNLVSSFSSRHPFFFLRKCVVCKHLVHTISKIVWDKQGYAYAVILVVVPLDVLIATDAVEIWQLPAISDPTITANMCHCL